MADARGIGAVDKDTLAALRLMASQVRAAGPEAARALRARVVDEIEAPLVAMIRARANGPHGTLAASTVKVSRGAVPSIWLGKGTGTAADVALGAEFGGRIRPPVPVIRRTRHGRHLYRRRTTQQFRPHRGQRGYWLVPTLKAQAAETVRKTIRIVDDVLAGIYGAEVIE